MAQLLKSYLLRGLLAGAAVGGMAALVALWATSREVKLQWLLLIGAGAIVGLTAGIATESISQIRRARDERNFREWKDASKGIVRQPLYDESSTSL